MAVTTCKDLLGLSRASFHRRSGIVSCSSAPSTTITASNRAGSVSLAFSLTR